MQVTVKLSKKQQERIKNSARKRNGANVQFVSVKTPVPEFGYVVYTGYGKAARVYLTESEIPFWADAQKVRIEA